MVCSPTEEGIPTPLTDAQTSTFRLQKDKSRSHMRVVLSVLAGSECNTVGIVIKIILKGGEQCHSRLD